MKGVKVANTYFVLKKNGNVSVKMYLTCGSPEFS